MLSASEVRKILDKIAEDAGIQKIDEQVYDEVFYKMAGSESYFMRFICYDNELWCIILADAVMIDSEIWTTGCTSIYPKGFDLSGDAVNMITDRLNKLITDYNKARKELKLKAIKNCGVEYDI